MSEYLEAFVLGNAAILGNVCLLPLYPGLLALLATRGTHGRDLRWLGVAVLAGVLTLLTVLAAVLHALGRAFADVVVWVVPVAYVAVILLGLAMVAGRNPLERVRVVEAPLGRSPVAGAFVYGLALGPMTLPCTGPVVLSAFVLGGVSGTGALVDGLAWFLAFGLGFGWPLVLLPWLAGRRQQAFTRWLARHHRVVTVASGLLLVVVAGIGLWVEFA